MPPPPPPSVTERPVPWDAALPPPPTDAILSEDQWTTLLAIADTFIPSIQANGIEKSTAVLTIGNDEFLDAVKKIGTEDSALATAYLNESVSSIPAFKDSLHRKLGHYLHTEGQKGISFILSALNTRAGCLVLTGSATPFHLQPIAVREKILLNWSASYLPPLRSAFKLLSLLAKNAWIQLSPTFGPTTGFPRVPIHGEPKKGFEYDFIQFSSGEGPEIIDTDVVIVGSGCGGGVSAKNISESGLRVIVVEKAYHYPPDYFPMTAREAGIHLFQNGGLDMTDDASVAILAGSAWGGGGLINWSASLQTQSYVREEWVQNGLPFFRSSEFQASLDRVCDRMGVSTDHIEHNYPNRAMMEGARKLGYTAKLLPQNTGNSAHYCGYCTFGCASDLKSGPAVSWLPDAAKAGAKFIEGFDTDRVLFDQSGSKKAIGIEGTWRSRDLHIRGSGISRKVIIKAKRVILSSGTLSSPLILNRSGVKNSNIGKHLHLHPAAHINAAWDDEEVRPWEGGIMTGVVDEFQNVDGRGHGCKIEVTAHVPSLFLTQCPWRGGLDYKLLSSQFRHMAGFVVIARDRDTGTVYPDPVDGRTRIKYTPSAYDLNNLLQGLIGAAKIAYASGARKIFPTVPGVPTFVRSSIANPEDGINDPDFVAWLEKLKSHGIPVPDGSVILSAHQMGSCRMGPRARNSVVDPRGKVWGVDGLYVADASIFPSASGVNPMVTNMAISDYISRGVARELKAVVDGTDIKLAAKL